MLVLQAYGSLTFSAEPHHNRKENGTALTAKKLSSILLKLDISHARILHAQVLVQSLQTNSVYRIKLKNFNKRLQHVFCQQKGSI